MADELPTFQFEDVPLDEARRMGRGPRIEPMLYDTLRQKIQALSSEAVRIHLGPEIRPERMKNYLLRIARELNVPVTVRRVPGGVIFWRSSELDARVGRIEADVHTLRDEMVHRQEFQDILDRAKYIERKLGIESGV
jgi:hypothetical protein